MPGRYDRRTRGAPSILRNVAQILRTTHACSGVLIAHEAEHDRRPAVSLRGSAEGHRDALARRDRELELVRLSGGEWIFRRPHHQAERVEQRMRHDDAMRPGGNAVYLVVAVLVRDGLARRALDRDPRLLERNVVNAVGDIALEPRQSGRRSRGGNALRRQGARDDDREQRDAGEGKPARPDDN